MAASNPNGQMTFGFNGFPFPGLQLGTNDGGQMTFGESGFTFGYLFPAGPPPSTNIGTFNGLIYSNSATVNELVRANIATINGLA